MAAKKLGKDGTGDDTTLAFETVAAWTKWLEAHHATSRGLWMKLAKKGSGGRSIDYAKALEVALCWGWIDGQKRALDDAWWLQRFTPRGAKSVWSKINREKSEALIAAGKMTPTGLAAVDAAKRDGRWAAAYDSPKSASMPDDLARALDDNPRAKAFFATLDAANRYSMVWRVQTAKRAETRARKITDLVARLAKHQKLHP